jgi:hypothetical protein
MAEFTSRDKTIATLLNFGLLLAFALYIIFVDGFRTLDRIYTEMGRMVGSGGMLSFEVEWFACLAITLAMFLWGRFVRKGLLRINPPWLALAAMWMFCTACGVLGMVLYVFNMIVITEMEDWLVPILQGGIFSFAFPMLALGGMVRPLPKK